MGSGQKLCRLDIFISPESTASRMPGMRLMRVPWLNSAYLKPSSRISRSMARPSVCRWEFQQVENEYMRPPGMMGCWIDGVLDWWPATDRPSIDLKAECGQKPALGLESSAYRSA